jgi:hypothetical protein
VLAASVGARWHTRMHCKPTYSLLHRVPALHAHLAGPGCSRGGGPSKGASLAKRDEMCCHEAACCASWAVSASLLPRLRLVRAPRTRLHRSKAQGHISAAVALHGLKQQAALHVDIPGS